MVKLSEVERAALDDIFTGMHTDRVTVVTKIIDFFKRFF